MIFCSYAHADNDGGWVDALTAELGAAYRKLTGEPAEIFVDRESLMTSDIWETKIKASVEASQMLIAVISPSYIRSDWCQLEWNQFEERETLLRSQGLLDEEQGLIFPILLFPLDRGRFDQQQRSFVEVVRRRQWLDVSSQLDGPPIRPEQVRTLVESLIDTEAELETRRHRLETKTANAADGFTIHDPGRGIEWAASLSLEPFLFDEALDYVKQLRVGDTDGWRLPTRDELESLIDPALLAETEDDPTASPYPLREPFNAQRYGVLHSGTPVGDEYEGHWVMNVRNGHIYNGHLEKAYVRAVRDLI